MRRVVAFDCHGARCTATLDAGPRAAGLLIVSGGNEIRIGAHRGMARLAQDVAAQGYPVFRFDRRGIGDSDGDNGGFLSSGPDVTAALAALRAEAPHLSRIVAFGNCDAATALVLHNVPVDALVLANPWVIEPKDDLPPPAAIRDRYARRLRDLEAWKALISGRVNIAAVARGLGRIVLPSKAADLATSFADALAASTIPAHILLATRDGTALAFADAWKAEPFAAARARDSVTIQALDSASHSFASEDDYAALKAALIAALVAEEGLEPPTRGL